MSLVYLDSSALAKLYLPELSGDRQQVIALLDRYGRAATCAITYAEVCGALARYYHAGRSTEAEYQENLRLFEEDWALFNVIDLSPALSRRAGQLLKAHRSLRAMDALQLSAALEARAAISLKFLTFDTDLAAAAQGLMPDAVA